MYVHYILLELFHFESNPIELVEVNRRHNVASKNITFEILDPQNVAEVELHKIGPGEWQHVVRVEDKDMEYEALVDIHNETNESTISWADDSDNGIRFSDGGDKINYEENWE